MRNLHLEYMKIKEYNNTLFGGFMAFIPIELFEYEVNISKNEIISRLNSNIEPTHIFRWANYGKPYFGEIYPDGFKMTRHSIMRNSFRPLIIGNIIHTENRILLRIVIRLYLWIPIVAGILVLGIPVIAAVFSFIDKFQTLEIKNIVSVLILLISLLSSLIFIIFCIGLLLYPVITFLFKIESRKSKQFIEELLEGRLIKEEKNIIKLLMCIIRPHFA